MNWKTYNLNRNIRVKLNDKGYQLLADEHNNYCGYIPTFKKRTLQFYKKKADKEGYTKFHLWEFMQLFGHVTGMGFDQYYDINILIENDESKEKQN
jgi:hypothetical protein